MVRNPRELLGHWLELERGSKPPPLQSVPAGLQNFLFETGRILRAADELLREKSKLTSPLLKVQFFARSQAHLEKIKTALQTIDAERETLLEELKRLDGEFLAGSAAENSNRGALPFARIESIYHALGFCARSAEQLRERIVQISF